MSLAERTRTGLREMPSNAAWLVSRVLKPADAVGTAAESVAAGARNRGRQVAAAVVDAAPIGGDSVETRLRRAREAAERAREAEDRALEAATESKERSDHARQVAELGRARLKELDREASRRVKQRVADAQRAANEFVERERRAAEAEADRERQESRREVDEAIEDARQDAEASRERAEELVGEAAGELAEARRLADEAAEAARAAAEEAQRQATQLTMEAEQQATDVGGRIKATEQVRAESSASIKPTPREVEADSPKAARIPAPPRADRSSRLDREGVAATANERTTP